ncbi:methyl-accepting chemotaxis protein [Pseudomonas duriflava]|uniref:Methyl-accepting chemotaxis protein n=1 Tax=Pseudomonas duriflava TaxID=459528 RepID=A0A562PS19_9PSED|nr:methyl-accepting chemotaxis protein [Pseudomonas duriflava]
MSFRNLRVSQRSALGFGLIGLIVLILGVFSLKQMADIRERSSEVGTGWMPSIVALGDLSDNIMRTRIFALRLVLINDSDVDQSTRES